MPSTGRRQSPDDDTSLTDLPILPLLSGPGKRPHSGSSLSRAPTLVPGGFWRGHRRWGAGARCCGVRRRRGWERGKPTNRAATNGLPLSPRRRVSHRPGKGTCDHFHAPPPSTFTLTEELAFSPIPAAWVLLGIDELPPSWDPVVTPNLMYTIH